MLLYTVLYLSSNCAGVEMNQLPIKKYLYSEVCVRVCVSELEVSFTSNYVYLPSNRWFSERSSQALLQHLLVTHSFTLTTLVSYTTTHLFFNCMHAVCKYKPQVPNTMTVNARKKGSFINFSSCTLCNFLILLHYLPILMTFTLSNTFYCHCVLSAYRSL